MKRVLVVAAHPDDEILGVGATIAKHVDAGDEAFALILGEGILSREDVQEKNKAFLLSQLRDNTLAAAKIIGYKNVYFSAFWDNRFDYNCLLDIVKVVEKYIQMLQPDIVYTHNSSDLNIDHQLTFKAVMTATRPGLNAWNKAVYSFEILSSTEWNFDKTIFSPNVFVDIEGYLEKKLEAMKCYQTELRDFPHPRSLKGLEIAAQKWGMVVGKQYAEAFKLIREIID